MGFSTVSVNHRRTTRALTSAESADEDEGSLTAVQTDRVTIIYATVLARGGERRNNGALARCFIMTVARAVGVTGFDRATGEVSWPVSQNGCN